MALGYPWGTYTPIGTYDRSDEQQAALDSQLDDYAALSSEAFYAALSERMGVEMDAHEVERCPNVTGAGN